MATHSGAWVGWDGGTRGIPATLPDLSVRLLPVGLSAARCASTTTGSPTRRCGRCCTTRSRSPRFERAWWHSYQDVNAIFADEAVAALDERPDAIAWVHDYHLMLVPQLIRERRRGSADRVLPARALAVAGHLRPAALAGADPARAARRRRGVLPHRAATGTTSSGPAAACWPTPASQMHGSQIVLPDGRVVPRPPRPSRSTRRSSPASPPTRRPAGDIEALSEQFADRTLLLGVDRLDYTKGIIERLLAVEMLLERRPDLRHEPRVPAGRRAQPGRRAGVPQPARHGGTAHRPDQRPVHRAGLATCRCTTCTGGCRRSSSPPTTRSPTRCSSRR